MLFSCTYWTERSRPICACHSSYYYSTMTDVRAQSVSAPGQSYDVRGMIGIVCEGLEQDRNYNVDASVEFHDGVVRSKNLPDLLASDDVFFFKQKTAYDITR